MNILTFYGVKTDAQHVSFIILIQLFSKIQHKGYLMILIFYVYLDSTHVHFDEPIQYSEIAHIVLCPLFKKNKQNKILLFSQQFSEYLQH